MATLYDSGNFWHVFIDENALLPFEKSTEVKGRKGTKIIRAWGKDYKGNLKLKSIYYPKSAYSLDRMRKVMRKYENCPLCKIGKSGSKFINQKNNIKNMVEFSIIDGLGKIPKIGGKITGNRNVFQPIVMQSLANISRIFPDMVLPEIVRKFLYFGLGAGGVWLVNKKSTGNMKGEWIDFFANYIAMVFDPTPDQMNRMATEINQLKAAIKTRSLAPFKPAFASKNEVKSAMINMISSLGLNNAFSKLGFAKRMRMSEGTGQSIARSYNKALDRGFHANAMTADDFGYVDTSKRFKDVSKFSTGFRNKRRLMISGVNQG